MICCLELEIKSTKLYICLLCRMTAISPGKTIVAGVLVIVYEARSVSHYGARPVCVLVNTLVTHMVKVLGFVFNRKVAGNAYASIDFLPLFTLSIEQKCLSLWSYEDIQAKGEAGDQSVRF